MTNPVTGPTGGAVTAADLSRYTNKPAAGASTPAVGSSSTLDKDAFLKLLVAQLKYQDPMNPSSSDQFIATTAQFTMVEKLDQLAQQGTATALVSSLTTASAMIGRSISAIQNGLPVDATVQRSKIVSGEVVLETDKGEVHLNEIASVGPSAAAANLSASDQTDPALPPDANPTTQVQEQP